MKKITNLSLAIALTGISFSTFSTSYAGTQSGNTAASQATSESKLPSGYTFTVDKSTGPVTGENSVGFTLSKEGKPVVGLAWTATVQMTSMDMGTTHPKVTEDKPGHYSVKASYSMEGPWRLNLTAKDGATVINNSILVTVKAAPDPSPSSSTTATSSSDSSMAGMSMSGSTSSGTSKQGGSMEMTNSSMNALAPTKVYTAGMIEDPATAVGFGKNLPMVEMMNKMMVGGSSMESMKMAPMKMSFGKDNYSSLTMPVPANLASTALVMPGNSMPGMKMPVADPTGSAPSMPQPSPASPAPVPNPNMPAPASSPKASPTMDPAMDMSVKPALTIVAHLEKNVKVGLNEVHIHFTGKDGKPIDPASIVLTVQMTSMDMGTAHPKAKKVGVGHYSADVSFSMSGPWAVSIKATLKGQKPVVKSFQFNP